MITIASSRLGRNLMIGLALCAFGACSTSEPTMLPPGIGNAGGSGGGSGGTTAGTGGTTAGTGGTTAGSGGASGAAGGAGGGAAGAGGSGGSSVVDAGGGDAPADGVVAGNCTGAPICDNFGRATLGPDWILDNNQTSTMIEMVTNKGHNDMNSVHLSVGTAATQSFISTTKGFPATANTIWGRAWLWSTIPLLGHQIYVEARVGAGSDGMGIRPVNTGVNGVLKVLAVNIEKGDAGKTSAIMMPMGSWNCYEWQITGIGGMGSVTSYLDGAMIATLTNVAVPALTRTRIGLQRYSGGTAGEMWIDDVAIGPARIPCGP